MKKYQIFSIILSVAPSSHLLAMKHNSTPQSLVETSFEGKSTLPQLPYKVLIMQNQTRNPSQPCNIEKAEQSTSSKTQVKHKKSKKLPLIRKYNQVSQELQKVSHTLAFISKKKVHTSTWQALELEEDELTRERDKLRQKLLKTATFK